MSSHREAPAISKDPVADSTDLYAFVSPDAPETVTILANYVPLQDPAGGPNFFEFGAKTVVGTAARSATMCCTRSTSTTPARACRRSPTSSSSPPRSLDPRHVPLQHRTDHLLADTGYSPTWNRRQTYTVTRIDTDPDDGQSTSTPISPPGSGGASPARRATSASARRPTTRPCRRRPSIAVERADRLRRPAGRGLLRRPGLHLRPRRPAAALEPTS